MPMMFGGSERVSRNSYANISLHFRRVVVRIARAYA
jgi:hypothetical protein